MGWLSGPHERKVLAAVLALTVTGGIWIGVRVWAAASPEPGSPEDPLVSKSYVEQYVQQALRDGIQDALQKQAQPLLQQMQQAVQAVSQQTDSLRQQSQFAIVNVKQGFRLIAPGGTELVLRGGEAFVIAGSLGGLADLTTGIDLQEAMAVPANHHLLVPRTENRGIRAATDLIVLVRGPYSIDLPVGPQPGTSGVPAPQPGTSGG